MAIEPSRTLELDNRAHQMLHRWEWMLERIGMFVMVIAIGAALIGLLGPGILSQRSVSNSASQLSVEYAAVQRSAAPAELRIRFRPEKSADGFSQLSISRPVLESVAIESMMPVPESMTTHDDRIVMS